MLSFCRQAGKLLPGYSIITTAARNGVAILREVFLARSTAEWVEFARVHNTAIAPVNTPRTLLNGRYLAGRTLGQAAGSPPGMIDGPVSAPSSPPWAAAGTPCSTPAATRATGVRAKRARRTGL